MDFNNSLWQDCTCIVGRAFKLSGSELKNLRKCEIAKLIAALPFLADCDDPDRTSIAHLSTYLIGGMIKKTSSCRISDETDLFRRLKMLDHFIGGKTEIIQRGMNLLAVNMLSNYQRDSVKDQKENKYNPIVSNKIQYEAELKKLEDKIRKVSCPKMDEIITFEIASRCFWIFPIRPDMKTVDIEWTQKVIR